MFRIYKTNTESISGSTASNNYVTVRNHLALEDRLQTLGIKLEEVNFWIHQALPGRSFGRFLVYESEWIAKGLDSGDIQVDLSIADQNESILFEALDVVATSFIMSPLQTANQDEERLLLVELELTREKFYTQNHVCKTYESYTELANEFYPSTGMLYEPYLFNPFPIPDVPFVEFAAYIAATNFLVAFIPRLAGSAASYKVNLTGLSTNFGSISSYARLIYNSVQVNKSTPAYKIKLQSNKNCLNEVVESNPQTVTLTESFFYDSPVNTTTSKTNISYLFPYGAYSPEFTDGVAIADTIAYALQTYASSRLNRDLDILYLGVVNVDISMDVQKITWRFDRTGFTTRLESIPWTVDNIILRPLAEPCEDVIYEATLTSTVIAGYALGIIAELGNPSNIINLETMIRDPLGLWEGLKLGSKVYVYQKCGCVYHIVQGPCPNDNRPTSSSGESTGRCCVKWYTQGVGTTTYCYVIPQSICDYIGTNPDAITTWNGALDCTTPCPEV